MGNASVKESEMKVLLNLAIARLAVLKNNRLKLCDSACTEVLQLLQSSQHERALLRAEQVVKARNMLDAFAMIEGYCILLSERIDLIKQQNDECPAELKEAISTLIFASARFSSGEFPELQHLRSLFKSRYGAEFALRADEMRNNCGVNLTMIQKLSANSSSLETRMEVLKQISPSKPAQEKLNHGKISKQAEKLSVNSRIKVKDESKNFPGDYHSVDILSNLKTKSKKYKDVVEASQDAFMSAAYAAAAARAAVELSKSNPGGSSSNGRDRRKYDERKKVEKFSSYEDDDDDEQEISARLAVECSQKLNTGNSRNSVRTRRYQF